MPVTGNWKPSSHMRRQTILAVVLASAVSFLLGALLTGDVPPVPAVATVSGAPARPPAARTSLKSSAPVPGAVNFADVAERINAAVVNIDAATRAGHEPRRRRDDTSDPPRDFDVPHQGSGSGFIIDRQGFILTNFHVIE